MKHLPADTVEDFEYRIKSSKYIIDKVRPENAINEMKSISFARTAWRYLYHSILLNMVGNHKESEQYIADVVPLARTSVSYDLDPSEGQVLLFRLSLLVGDRTQADESANILSKMDINLLKKNSFHFATIIIAHLYLQQTSFAKEFLPEIRKLEIKKSDDVIDPGMGDAIQGIVERNTDLLIAGLTSLLELHQKKTRYCRTELLEEDFVSFIATTLCIVGLRNDLDIKPHVKNSQVALKSRPGNESNRPELPPKKRFIIPVDLIPEYMLSPWRD